MNNRRCGMKPSAACEECRLLTVERSMLRRSNRDDAAGLELVDFLQNWVASGSSTVRVELELRRAISMPGSAQLSGPADPAAGERVFFHAKGPGCYRCHQVQGRGSRAGPDLTTLAAGVDRRRLIESIVSPSKEIAPQFVAYAVARNDGTVFSGILLEQSPEGELDLRRFTRPQDPGEERRYRRAKAAGDLDHARRPGPHDDEAGDARLAGVLVAQEVTGGRVTIEEHSARTGPEVRV